ncbi:MAG: thiamine pyrophosphate-binding protein [Alphaproteobacteria bacterium]
MADSAQIPATVSTVTEAIVDRLAAAGVTHIFGVPGGECNLDFIAAADKLGVHFVLTRNETAASIMACVASELTGAPGVAMTTRGPGLAAAANGACYSQLDRAAMVLIADGYEDSPDRHQPPTRRSGRDAASGSERRVAAEGRSGRDCRRPPDESHGPPRLAPSIWRSPVRAFANPLRN